MEEWLSIFSFKGMKERSYHTRSFHLVAHSRKKREREREREKNKKKTGEIPREEPVTILIASMEG